MFVKAINILGGNPRGWADLEWARGIQGTESVPLATGRYAIVKEAGGVPTHELGHSLGLTHAGNGVQGRENKPNYWSVMSYGIELPISQLANGIEINPSQGGDYSPYPLFPMDQCDDPEIPGGDITGGAPSERFIGYEHCDSRPGHFSREEMCPIDEANLREDMGLVGMEGEMCTAVTGGETKVFNLGRIWDRRTLMRDDIANVWRVQYFDEFPVSWIDWNQNNTFDPETQYQENLDGGCAFDDETGQWENVYTGATGATIAVCWDALSGHNDIEYLSDDARMSLWTVGESHTKQYWLTMGVEPQQTAPVPLWLQNTWTTDQE